MTDLRRHCAADGPQIVGRADRGWGRSWVGQDPSTTCRAASDLASPTGLNEVVPPPPTPYLALVLREARRWAGLSQRELAARAGQPASSVAAIEAERSDVPVTRFASLLNACGWDLHVVDAHGEVIDGLVDSGLRDRGRRRYPAHVELRSTTQTGSWWGDRWGYYWGRPPRPRRTFDLPRRDRGNGHKDLADAPGATNRHSARDRAKAWWVPSDGLAAVPLTAGARPRSTKHVGSSRTR